MGFSPSTNPVTSGRRRQINVILVLPDPKYSDSPQKHDSVTIKKCNSRSPMHPQVQIDETEPQNSDPQNPKQTVWPLGDPKLNVRHLTLHQIQIEHITAPQKKGIPETQQSTWCDHYEASELNSGTLKAPPGTNRCYTSQKIEEEWLFV